MNNREQKIKELMESIQLLKHNITFKTGGYAKIPRVTASQWGVLMMIEEHSGGTVKDVAKALGVSSSAATQLIDGLVANGYVVRDEDTEDRRKVILKLSKKTKKQVERMKIERTKNLLKLFKVLSDKELDQFILLNKKIIKGFADK